MPGARIGSNAVLIRFGYIGVLFMQANPFLSLLLPEETSIPSKRRCSKCDQLQSIELFKKHKLGKYGLNPSCRLCETNRMRMYRLKLKRKAEQ